MTWKMRKGAAFAARDTARRFAPGPLMVIFLLITSSALVRLIAPVTAKLIVSLSCASASAWRSEPGPLSFVLVTVMVSARADMPIAQRTTKQIQARRLKKADSEILRVLATPYRS